MACRSHPTLAQNAEKRRKRSKLVHFLYSTKTVEYIAITPPPAEIYSTRWAKKNRNTAFRASVLALCWTSCAQILCQHTSTCLLQNHRVSSYLVECVAFYSDFADAMTKIHCSRTFRCCKSFPAERSQSFSRTTQPIGLKFGVSILQYASN